MTRDPAAAPPRPELSFLRHRAKPKPQPPSPAAEFVSGHTPHPAHHAPPPPPAAAPPAAAPPAAPPPSAAAPPPVSSSLDLSADAPAPSRPAAPPAARAAPAARVHHDRRIRAGEHQLLGVTAPTVTLTRVQSGVGALQIEAVCSAEVGDLRLGAAYQLRGGVASTVQYAGGNRFAPSSRRPVIVAGRDEYEHLRIDLRQSRELERLAVYAVSEARAELVWGGTLVVTTFGGAHVELPLETLQPGSVAVLLSIYNLDGEFVVRAEMETMHAGDIRDAARAYGYDRITWRDDRSPVD
jgi:uncharacterized protein involved in tellurium resistance